MDNKKWILFGIAGNILVGLIVGYTTDNFTNFLYLIPVFIPIWIVLWVTTNTQESK